MPILNLAPEKLERDWGKYLSVQRSMPGVKQIPKAILNLPEGSRALDFGAGDCRWARSFQDNVPGLTVDVLDLHLDKAAHMTNGERYHMDATKFEPTHRYQAIHARSILFFLGEECERTFARLADSLEKDGVIMFTMPDKTNVAKSQGIICMDDSEITQLCWNNGLYAPSSKLDPRNIYGEPGCEIIVPLYHITARKR